MIKLSREVLLVLVVFVCFSVILTAGCKGPAENSSSDFGSDETSHAFSGFPSTFNNSLSSSSTPISEIAVTNGADLSEDPHSQSYSSSNSISSSNTNTNSLYSGSGSASIISDPAKADIITPAIVSTKFPSGSIVIADQIPVNSRYGADPTGIKDSTSAIQQAIDDCYYTGGGTVFLPAGRYRITRQVRIRPFVTLRGDWQDPDTGREYGTIILADVPSEDSMATGTFILGGSSGAVGLTVFYPGQSLKSVKPYPFTFYIPGTSMGNDHYMLQSIVNCSVINGYRGIGACVSSGVHEMMTIENFKGTFLSEGAVAYNQADVGTWNNIVFSGKYWAESGLTGFDRPDSSDLDDYLQNNGVGLVLGDLEWTQFSGVSIENYETGIHIVKGKRIEFAGSMYDVYVTGSKTALKIDSIDERWGMLVARGVLEGSEFAVENNTRGTVKIAGADVRGGVKGSGIIQDEVSLDHLPDTHRTPIPVPPARLYNVSKDYGADKTGSVDASVSIQHSVNEAASAGGGVVYLSAGKYRLDSPVDIPANVELRGSSPVAVRDMSGLSLGTVILAYYGQNPGTPDRDRALISLTGKGAGIRGIRIIYPENSPAEASVIPYTYAIRGKADNVYIVDSSISAAYYGIDLQDADNAVVSRLVSCCYMNTIRLERSHGSVIELSLQNGTVITRNGLSLSGWLTEDKIFSHLFDPITRQNAFYLKASDCRDLKVSNCFAYGVRTLLSFDDCLNTSAINIGADNIGRNVPLLSVISGSTVVVNMMRYNGKSYESDSADLQIYNRLSINISGENNIG